MMHAHLRQGVLAAVAIAGTAVSLAQPSSPEWGAFEAETMKHFEALVRFDTSDPPGGEEPAAVYLVNVLEAAGIPAQTYTLEPRRTNVVARLRGSGKKRPLLLMAHTDVVNIDPSKWKVPPFAAVRDGGYVYGRGTLDDKDNVTAALMTLLTLKRLNVALDRDVIFLAEAGEEGNTRVGIEFMVQQHFPDIEAEYCLAEGGGVTRAGGDVKYASVQTLEKIPRAIELTARGTAGHGSIPLITNAIVRLSAAVAAVGRWRAPIRLNETTAAYFQRLAAISSREDAGRYRAVLSVRPQEAAGADAYFVEHEPRHASMIRTSVSPNIFQAGYRSNVIPSEARATLDVRLLPDEDQEEFLETIRAVINDPDVEVRYIARSVRPGGAPARLDSEAFAAIEAAVKRSYATVTLPTMSTGATDMAYLRAKGIHCYGIGPAVDVEDGPKGFGAHGDQERILERELHRFVRFHWELVNDLVRTPSPPTR